MRMTRRDVRDRVHELTGERPKSAHRRLVLNGRVTIFEEDFDSGIDIHIIPCITINNKSDEADLYYQDTEQVWVLKANQFVGWRNPEVQKRLDIRPMESDTTGNKYYTLPVSVFTRIYPLFENQQSDNNQPDNKPEVEDWGVETNKQVVSAPSTVTRDFAAIMLRYPDADSEWINEMIREANRIQGVPNPTETIQTRVTNKTLL